MDESQTIPASRGATGAGRTRERASADEPTAAEPRNPDEARREIEATRERISAAFDRLGHQLGQKKEELREKADVLRPVRRKVRELPMPALGAAFLVGVLIGVARGGRRRAEAAPHAEREMPLEPGEEAVVDVEHRRVYAHPYAPKYSFLHELRSVLAHQIGNAVVGGVAGLISARMARQDEQETGERQASAPPYGLPF